MKLIITIDGRLTPDEIMEMIQKVRDVEQRETGRLFVMWVEAPQLTVEDATAVMGNLRPPLPVTQTIFR